MQLLNDRILCTVPCTWEWKNGCILDGILEEGVHDGHPLYGLNRRPGPCSSGRGKDNGSPVTSFLSTFFSNTRRTFKGTYHVHIRKRICGYWQITN